MQACIGPNVPKPKADPVFCFVFVFYIFFMISKSKCICTDFDSQNVSALRDRKHGQNPRMVVTILNAIKNSAYGDIHYDGLEIL